MGLTAAHTLFLREHNRAATDIATRLGTGDSTITALFDPSIPSRGDFIYEISRKVVGAEVQVWTWHP